MLLNCGVGEDSRESLGSNLSFLKEISSEYSLEGLMLKLKLQISGLLVWRTYSFEQTLMLGKIEGRRRRGRQRMRWLDGITDLMDMSCASSGSWWWTGKPGLLQFMGSLCIAKSWTRLSNWTELENTELKIWGITPHLLGLLNSIYMAISTAGGEGTRSLPHCWRAVWTATL